MWVRVARVGKPFGVAGRVTVQVFTDAPELRFRAGALLARDENGGDPLQVAWTGRSGSRWVLGFAGITDRTGAEGLRHTELYADADPDTGGGAHPGADEWFDWQLIGLPCTTIAGAALGEVVAVEHLPAHDSLVVRTPEHRLGQIPLVAGIVVSVGAEGVVVDPPGGLLERDLTIEAPEPGDPGDRP